MNKIVGILAEGLNGEIGSNTSETGLPWDPIPQDFKHFQNVTKELVNIVMGPKTFEIIKKLSGGKLLFGRQIYLLSKTIEVSPDPRVILVRTPEEVIAKTIEQGQSLAVGGGRGVYKTFIPFYDQIIMTLVHGSFSANCFTPEGLLDGFVEDREKEKILRAPLEDVCKVTVHYFEKK